MTAIMKRACKSCQAWDGPWKPKKCGEWTIPERGKCRLLPDPQPIKMPDEWCMGFVRNECEEVPQ